MVQLEFSVKFKTLALFRLFSVNYLLKHFPLAYRRSLYLVSKGQNLVGYAYELRLLAAGPETVEEGLTSEPVTPDAGRKSFDKRRNALAS